MEKKYHSEDAKPYMVGWLLDLERCFRLLKEFTMLIIFFRENEVIFIVVSEDFEFSSSFYRKRPSLAYIHKLANLSKNNSE